MESTNGIATLTDKNTMMGESSKQRQMTSVLWFLLGQNNSLTLPQKIKKKRKKENLILNCGH